MKCKFLPRLVHDPNLPESDKDKIRELLDKPFFPYLRRHIGISEKARQLPDHSLRLFSGWTKSSKMPEIYTHELGDEITNQILQIEGFMTRSTEQNDMLKPKACPNSGNCSDNKPDAKFCTKCKMVLSYDAYTEVKEHNEGINQSRFEKLEAKIDEMQRQWLSTHVTKDPKGQIPISEQEIEFILQRGRKFDKVRRKRDRKILEGFN